MVRLEKAVVARYTHSGHRFELLVDPNLAMEFKKGKSVDLNELLAEDTVFKNASKGERQSEALLKQVFKTNEIEKIFPVIIEKGEIQLTTEQRRKLKERKTREIVQLIARNSFNPQTNTPHPEQRILNAMQEAKINIDPLKPTATQFREIADKLRGILPISFEKQRVKVKIPAEFAGKIQGAIREFEVIKEEWLSDGSFVVVLEVPAGMKSKAISLLSNMTSGKALFFDIK